MADKDVVIGKAPGWLWFVFFLVIGLAAIFLWIGQRPKTAPPVSEQTKQSQNLQKKFVHTRVVKVGAGWKRIGLPWYVATTYKPPPGEILRIKRADNGWEFELTAEERLTYTGPHDFIEGDCGKIYYKGDDTGIYFGKRAFEAAAVYLASKSGREISIELLEWPAEPDDPATPYCGEQKSITFNNPLGVR
ncbi:MAG: hypothetical protein HYW34_01040 [Candidatus Brennerbacteria bacterium]|nr:hypothetical protein [Candidatus Brennerbacteria bacterium]